ncbi:MAG: M23 family metallopeptidase, partial [Chloroflexota bacterium]|nr:M23 family metallopeptidase [Chloroflexota bacterium]
TLAAAQAAPPVPVPSPAATPTGTPSVTVTKRKLPALEWPLALKPPTTSITQRFQPGHTGIDVGAPAGTPIKAMAAGAVKRADKGDNGGYGWLVVVDHGEGITTWYAHLSEIAVSVGDKVQVGQKLGEAGTTGRSTGPHLHFELRINSTPIDPLLALPK